MQQLLAKSSSKRGVPELALEQHLCDVVEATECLFGSDVPTRLHQAWLRFFRISEAASTRFVATLRAAAALHDIGKANDGFQDAVRRQGDQAIRHEHLSALLIHSPTVWQWLIHDESIDWQIVLSAVLTHHQKCLNRSAIASLSAGRKVVSAPFDRALATCVVDLLRRSGIFPTWPQEWRFDFSATGISKEAERLDDALDEFDRDLPADPARNRMLRAVRAALICADAAASGLRRESLSLSDWIGQQFAETADSLCDADYIHNQIIQRRIDELVRKKKWTGWHKFQIGASTQPSPTLLLAPCGAGKTLAAWKWIEEQARCRAAKRVIFLYPTRATATEGFKDYVSWAPEADASLIHGTSAYELEDMFENPPEPDDRAGADFHADPRLFAVGYWSKRVFSATVDQFLAFLHHAYGATCLLPVLADSIVVIDEVHSFDPAMFSSLKAFLQQFDVPSLCMTATLLKAQRHQLVNQCGVAVYEDRPEDLAKIADAPRYRLRKVGRGEVADIVKDAIRDKKRVLWVVNQVAIAQGIAQDARDGKMFTPDGIPVLCYHSRFTLDDRKARHREVVDAFKPPKNEPPRAVFAVTTQVCEMSLDLDADVLITELCPVTSLVQRTGRCNRKPCVPSSVGEVHVYSPENERPYEKDDIRSASAFIDELLKLARPVSQTDLEQSLQKHGRKPPQGDRLIPFVSSSPYADGRNDPFRDIEEHCVQGVLDEATYAATDRVRRPGLILPVPRKLRPQPCAHKDARRLVLAPADHYHPALGLCDKPIGGES